MEYLGFMINRRENVMEFKVGDKVKLKEKLEINSEDVNTLSILSRELHNGKNIIESIDNSGFNILKGSSYDYSRLNWLEVAPPELEYKGWKECEEYWYISDIGRVENSYIDFIRSFNNAGIICLNIKYRIDNNNAFKTAKEARRKLGLIYILNDMQATKEEILCKFLDKYSIMANHDTKILHISNFSLNQPTQYCTIDKSKLVEFINHVTYKEYCKYILGIEV